MHLNIGNAEIYHETVFFQSKILNQIISETKLDFLNAMEILQTQEIQQLKNLFLNHQNELLKYFDKNLFDINQEKNIGHGLYLFKEIFKNSKTLSKYSTKITLGNIINIFNN